jgi:hypothetical protein
MDAQHRRAVGREEWWSFSVVREKSNGRIGDTGEDCS